MALTNDDMDILLANYITGEADAEESAVAERWMAGGEENRRHVERLRRVWTESQELRFKGMADVETAWKNFRGRAADVRTIRYRIGWAAAAAVVLLVAGIGILLRPMGHRDTGPGHPDSGSGHPDTGPAMVRVFSTGMAKMDTLPDGSKVRLDAHSGLAYPAGFAGAQRKVSLTGGGFFEVTHDPRKPFSILVDGITVTVLGTSFSIRNDSGLTEIAVMTGVVEVAGLRRNMKLYAHERLMAAQPDSGWIKQVDIDVPTPADTRDIGDTVTPEKPKVEKQPKAKKQMKAMKSPKMQSDSAKVEEPDPKTEAVPKVQAAEGKAQAAPTKAQAAPAKMQDGPAKIQDEYQRQLATMKAIIEDVVTRGIVRDRQHLVGVVLSETELVVNAVRQPDDVYRQFRDKYLDGSGNGYFYGTINVQGKGYFFNRDDFK
jgi:transmembrane sensor